MKLTEEIKQKIDDFFNNISSEELFNLAVKKYGFEERAGIEILAQKFTSIPEHQYHNEQKETFEERENSSYALAA